MLTVKSTGDVAVALADVHIATVPIPSGLLVFCRELSRLHPDP